MIVKPLQNSYYITLYKKVLHFDCWIKTVVLELLKRTVKKDC